MKNDTITITIPSDDEGFVLLKCPKCGSIFKLLIGDIEDRSQLQIWCPECGMISDSYLSDDVIALVNKKITNYANNLVDECVKNFEKTLSKHKFIKVKTSKSLPQVPEDPLIYKISNLEEHLFKCCKRTAKIDPLLWIAGCYCPFCGELYDENN